MKFSSRTSAKRVWGSASRTGLLAASSARLAPAAFLEFLIPRPTLSWEGGGCCLANRLAGKSVAVSPSKKGT